MITVRRAILSVSDKSGVVDFARTLSAMGVKLIATGKTYDMINADGIEVIRVRDVTGFPEILNGRVKTLHPKIFGGILADKNNDVHMNTLDSYEIPPIDMVVLNFYPFERTIQSSDITLQEAIEQIDIGGPSMLRAAAKNCASVVPVCHPGQYENVLKELKETGGIKKSTSMALAKEAFARTMAYDGAIQAFLAEKLDSGKSFPDHLVFGLERAQDLRYGENPHLPAALYRWSSESIPEGVFAYSQIQGKELSFNNLYDLDGALKIPVLFEEPCAAIIKHANPCGVGTGQTLMEAYERALASDPVSAFGGIIAVNRHIGEEVARLIAERFFEVVAATGYSQEALEILAKKKKLILMQSSHQAGLHQEKYGRYIYKAIAGGMLVQKTAPLPVTAEQFTVATKRQPTKEEKDAMLFGWNIIGLIKSNAIVVCRENRTIGVGAGQMSRVDSSRIAIQKARDAGHELKGAVAASDAFFPFRDNIDLLAEAGITAIIQPGGSIRDSEVIEAADEHGMAMWLTGYRQFLH